VKAEPRADISSPLIEPAPWIWRRRSTGELVAVISKSWFDARSRAPLAFVERYRCGLPPGDLELVCNPVKRPDEARSMAAELERAPVRIVLRAECTEVPRVLTLDEVRAELAAGHRVIAPAGGLLVTDSAPLQGLRVNGSAPAWGDGFKFEQQEK